MRDHLESPDLGPAFVARALGISVSYLHNLFKNSGQTLNSLIIEDRLARCRDHLSSNLYRRYSVTEIAFNVGFRDLSHFSRRFKTQYGMSPRSFRRVVMKQRDTRTENL